MDKLPDLAAVLVPDDEVDLYNVTEGGWYAVDDADKAILGPFASLAKCDQAIHDRTVLVAPSALSVAPAQAS